MNNTVLFLLGSTVVQDAFERSLTSLSKQGRVSGVLVGALDELFERHLEVREDGRWAHFAWACLFSL